MSWLFDGEGVEYSDILGIASFEQRQKMLRQQEALLKQVGTLAPTEERTAARQVDGLHCPHCGGTLPKDAPEKKYDFCMHCRNRLLWDSYHLYAEKVAEKAFVEERLKRQEESDRRAAQQRENQLEANRQARELRKAEQRERQLLREKRKAEAHKRLLEAERKAELATQNLRNTVAPSSVDGDPLSALKPVVLACPKCSFPITVTERKAGVSVTCPGCHARFVTTNKRS